MSEVTEHTDRQTDTHTHTHTHTVVTQGHSLSPGQLTPVTEESVTYQSTQQVL